MAVSINSPEFAAAWRLVSEALLAYLQSEPEKRGDDNPSPEDPVPPVPEARTIQDFRFAACPIRQGDGSYIFKNLKDAMQEESTYKITRYTDGSCEFELCDLQGEQRQWFKDNRANTMPEKVGTATGEITRDNVITTIKKGKGKMDGRSVIITEPLMVEFK